LEGSAINCSAATPRARQLADGAALRSGLAPLQAHDCLRRELGLARQLRHRQVGGLAVLPQTWQRHTRIVWPRHRSHHWFCDVPGCTQKIFAERFEGALAAYARRTHDATELLQTLALQAGGEGGAGLAHKAGVPTSPETLLRLLPAMLDDAGIHAASARRQ
jgi:hypothetical protein